MSWHNVEQIRLSYSTMRTYHGCSRKYEFIKMFKHGHRDESLPGEVGHALHTGFQSYFIHRDREQAIFDMMLRYPIHLNSNPQDYRSVEACYATLNSMIDSGTFMEYDLAKVKCPDGTTRPAVEVPFEIEIKGIDFKNENGEPIKIIYVGFIDMILYDKVLDEYIVVDIKTTRAKIVEYEYDDQCLPYAFVLEKILGREISGLNSKYFYVFVDLKKPEQKVYSFIKEQAMILDWAKGLMFDLQNMRTMYELQWFPRKADSCLSWNKKCQFFGICGQRDHDSVQRYFLLDSKPYVETPIEPWFKVELELAA